MGQLKPDDFTVIVDTREQTPAYLGDFVSEVATLDTGDYSVKGLEQYIRLERKSLPDLIGCIGKERDRFQRELVRLRGFQERAVIVECNWSDIQLGQWRGRIKPSQVIGSVLRWQLDGIPFLFPGPRPKSCDIIQRLLYLSAKKYHSIHHAFKEKG